MLNDNKRERRGEKFTRELFNENLLSKVLPPLSMGFFFSHACMYVCMHNVRDFNYMCMLCRYLQRIFILHGRHFMIEGWHKKWTSNAT